jgi:hypothetical protein
MVQRLALSLALASFLVGCGALFVLARVDRRLAALEAPAERGAEPRPPLDGAFPGSPASRAGAAPDAEEPGILENKDPLAKLNWLIERVDEIDTNAFDYYGDVAQSLYDVKTSLKHLRHAVDRIKDALAAGGRLEPLLPPEDEELTPSQRETFAREAEGFGIRVEPGRVECRAFLNRFDPRMPIEYFATLFPEAGHETLVHFLGNRTFEDVHERGREAVEGLPSALYKALRAAGFREGDPGHPTEPTESGERQWVLPTGDAVYLYARYEEDGVSRLSRVTDWMIDPATEAVFPADSFKFTGSFRTMHPDTGDEVLAAEYGGLIISVQPMRSALLEIALETAVRNNYRYNFEKIPALEGEEKGVLFIDVIFSMTPLDGG